jgi:hypothetical protein
MSDINTEELDVQIRKTVNGLRDTVTQMIGEYMKIQHELRQCRNELCLKCGQYKEAYLGACDGCRYRKGGEWEDILNG